MFAGKTTRLIEEYNQSEFLEHEKLVIKPLLDTRYNKSTLSSHNGLSLAGNRINKPEEINILMTNDIREVYIDEIQFFPSTIVSMVNFLLIDNISVIASGLEKDFRNNDFGSMPQLLRLAQQKIKLFAKCSVCGSKATHTHRIAESEETILVGHQDTYEARCENCFVASLQATSR